MFKDLDPLFHSQLRLAIMSIVIGVKNAESVIYLKTSNSIRLMTILNSLKSTKNKSMKTLHLNLIVTYYSQHILPLNFFLVA
jgi:hypothetical protein